MMDLKPLAEQLGVAVEKLWSVLLTQAPISGFFNLIFYIVVIGIAYFTYRTWLWAHKNVAKNSADEILYLISVTLFILVVALVLISITSLHVTVAAFFNPEYWALREVLQHLNK